MGLIIGILMFMGLVLIHELGHFIAAKKSGVKVLEFGIGIPPKICKLRTDKSGTEYTLNLIPLGGFVRLKGEDPKHEEDFNAKDSFIKANIFNKFLILIAGVTANFLAARVIFAFVFTAGTKPISMISENMFDTQIESYLMPTKSFLYNQGLISEEQKKEIENVPVKVFEIMSGGLGEQMGIQSGDIIKSINSVSINAWNIEQILKNNIGGNISLYYTRNGVSKQTQGLCESESCLLGIIFSYSGFSKEDLTNLDDDFIKFPFIKSAGIALKEIKAQSKLTFYALGNLGKNLVSFDKTKISGALNKLSGPVGAVKFGDMLLEAGGWKQFLAFAGLISLALALFNVLPIPALDGGRLLGVLIQWIGRLKAEKYFTIEGFINLFFFILLMGLGIYIILKDLVRFWGVKIPFIG
ncbi:MAG: site-2 protease family protein [Candidatus Absconditabacteria bacterium]|nr:site-2 protease family protein [Candidatus Absconditabacteria bacterium]